jgi:hypothetical protein
MPAGVMTARGASLMASSPEGPVKLSFAALGGTSLGEEQPTHLGHG